MKKSVPSGTDFSCLNRSSLCQVAVKEGYDVGACACAVGNKGAVSGADGHAVYLELSGAGACIVADVDDISIAGAYTELSETSENGFAMLDEGQSS